MRAVDEGDLARRAAGGDGQAFAELYDRYESKIFNFCLRLVGNREDAADATQDAFVKVLQRLPSIPAERELNFGAYLFTAARNASYDVIGKRKRADAVDEIPERGATPLMGQEVGDVLMDPERAAMLSSFQTAVQDANARLPERQREVLALRELDDLSYDEIAEIMDMNRNSVAQLISRARIKLRDELRGSALASVAVSSAACERALPLIAKRQDGQLKDDADGDWLDDHLGACATCQVSVEAMAEAGVSYRAWAPVIPMAWLWKATTAHAMERTGYDWSDLLDRDRSHVLGDSGGSGGGAGGAGGAGAAGPGAGAGAEGAGDLAAAAATGGRERRRRRRAAALLGALLLLLIASTGVVLATADDTTPVTLDAAQPVGALAPLTTTTTAAAPPTTTVAAPAPVHRATHRRKRRRHPAVTTSAPVTTTANTTPNTTTQATIVPVQPATTSRPKPRPRPRPSGGTTVTSGGGSGSAGTGSTGGGSTGGGSTGSVPPPTTTTTATPPTSTAPADYCAQNPQDPKCGGTTCRPSAAGCPAPPTAPRAVLKPMTATRP